MNRVPVHLARELRAEGVTWGDIAQEIAWATGRKFSFDSVQNAVYASRRKTLRLPRDPEIDPAIAIDAVILTLWNLRKFDTCDIAKKVGLHEAEVVRRLNQLREAEKSHG